MLIDDSMMSGGSKGGGEVPLSPLWGQRDTLPGSKKTFSLKNRFFRSRCRKKAFQSEKTIFWRGLFVYGLLLKEKYKRTEK